MIQNGSVNIRTVHSLLAETWFVDAWKNELQPGEEWKVVSGYDNYIITSQGRIWSKVRNQWMVVSNSDDYYWRVGLSKNGKTTPKLIHTLVGRHFLPDYKEGLQIHHHNEELPFPGINFVGNLWAGTPVENTNDMMIKDRSNKSNKYGFMGVGHNGNTYNYKLCFEGKVINASGFATAEEAGKAYLAKRMELKGY